MLGRNIIKGLLDRGMVLESTGPTSDMRDCYGAPLFASLVDTRVLFRYLVAFFVS